MRTDFTYRGPEIDDAEILERLPQALQVILREINGYIVFNGAFHLRGACVEPKWHSIKEAWDGDSAFRRIYASTTLNDVPFGQDCLGDQYFLRGSDVIRLYSETGEVEQTGLNLATFIKQIENDPIDFLSLQPLIEFESRGGVLSPGQLLNAYPPFCTMESKNGVDLKAIAVHDRLSFLAQFYTQTVNAANGAKLKVSISGRAG